MPTRIVLITDDRAVKAAMKQACAEVGVELISGTTDPDTDPVEDAPDLVVCPHQHVEQSRSRWPGSGIVLLSRSSETEEMIDAIKQGAIDYLVWPVAPGELAQHLRSLLRVSRDIHVPAVAREDAPSSRVDEIVGQSPKMNEVYKAIGLIAPRDINVLITGESGTGKELVARALLQHSARHSGAYLAVNCAAIPETLLESELFGHERGAFTGADARRIGRFEQCHGGTLFLDEVGDIPLPTQAKLLRVLQDGSFQRLGGTKLIKSDVRIIAATNQPLEKMVGDKTFRQDLFYRLNVAGIHVPPLRDREVDAVLLAHYFVSRFAPELDSAIQSFSPDVLPLLLQYTWPGNVRELENAIKSALVVGRGNVLRPEHLPVRVRGEGPSDAVPVPSRPAQGTASDLESLERLATRMLNQHGDDGGAYRAALHELERTLLVTALTRTRGQAAAAARLLGISRTTMRRKMVELQIQISASSQGAARE